MDIYPLLGVSNKVNLNSAIGRFGLGVVIGAKAVEPSVEGAAARTQHPQLEKEETATVRGRAWYKLLDAPVLTLDVTV